VLRTDHRIRQERRSPLQSTRGRIEQAITLDDVPTAFGSAAREYLRDLQRLLDEVDLASVGRVFQLLREGRDRRATLFVAGNGGSAATASHWVNDLGKATKRSGRVPFQVMSLSDNVPWLTALANDEGFERVFSGQLENFARRDDLLVVISASGNSRNLICAVELARSLGMKTIGFLGFDGGLLKDKVDELVLIRTGKGEYELVEDIHAALCHVLTSSLVKDCPIAKAFGSSR
jgi:D-sedoheptulose 7-phosphate isomerase